MGCRSRSSWRPPGRRPSRSRRSRAGSTTASSSSSRGDGCHRPAIGRSGRPWTGATSCSRTTSGRCSIDCRSSPEASRSPPLPPSACPAWTAAPTTSSGGWWTRRSSCPRSATARRGTACSRPCGSTRPNGSESRGETADVRRRHADHFLTLAESAQTRGAGQLRGLRQLDADIDNLRTALDFAVASGDAETELRFVAALWPYWHVRGHLAEGRDRLESAIAREGATAQAPTPARSTGQGSSPGRSATTVGCGCSRRSCSTSPAATDSRSDEHAGYKLLSHVALRERHFAAAERYSKRTLALARKLDSDHDVSTAQLNLAVVYLDWGKTEAAIPMLEDVLAYNRRNGITRRVPASPSSISAKRTTTSGTSRERAFVSRKPARPSRRSGSGRTSGMRSRASPGSRRAADDTRRRPDCSVVRMRCWKRSAPPRTTSIRRWRPRSRRRLGRTSARPDSPPRTRTGGARRPAPRRSPCDR